MFKSPATIEVIINIVSFLAVIGFILMGRRKKKARLNDEENLVFNEVKEAFQKNPGQSKGFATSQNGLPLPYELEYWLGNKNGIGKRQDFTVIWGKFSFPLGVHLVISPENSLSKVFKWFGIRDEEIGNPEFDRKFFIKSNHRSILPLIFTQEIQEAFHEMPFFYLFSTTSPLQIQKYRGGKKKDSTEHINPENTVDKKKRSAWVLQLKGRVHDPDILIVAIEKALKISTHMEKYSPPALQGEDQIRAFDKFRYPSFQAISSAFLITLSLVGILLLWKFGLI